MATATDNILQAEAQVFEIGVEIKEDRSPDATTWRLQIANTLATIALAKTQMELVSEIRKLREAFNK